MYATKLIVMHIPKTAGTTLRSIIDRQYMPNEIYYIYTGDRAFNSATDFEALPEDRKQIINVFMGHFNFGLHANIHQECSYISLLRNPATRVISYYNHVMTHFERWKNNNISLGDFIEQQCSIESNNWQTRMLSNKNPPYNKCTKEMLESAKTHLENKFFAIGLNERFDESLILFRRKLGWRTPFYVRENITKNKPGIKDFSQSEIDLVIEHNYFDCELYEFAEHLFEKQIKDEGDMFTRELQEFKLINSHSHEWLKSNVAW